MNLPFTVDEFLGVFERYNLAFWPMQVVAYLLAVLAIFLAVGRPSRSDRVISGILSFFWLWIGSVYHLVFFTSINKAAYLFGALFVIEGILFLIAGVIRPRLSFHFRLDTFCIIGALFLLYAMVVYPILGYLLGHGYPKSPSFGITPCPATIFTFGLLLWSNRRVPSHVLWIPLLWSVIGSAAAFSLGIREDSALVAAGVIGTSLLLLRGRESGPDSA